MFRDGLTVTDLLGIGLENKSTSCDIITVKGYKVMMSYGSLIAVITPSGRIGLGAHWKHSSTTSKHRNAFLGEDTATTQKHLDSGKYILLAEKE